jgi:hypothetical protein
VQHRKYRHAAHHGVTTYTSTEMHSEVSTRPCCVVVLSYAKQKAAESEQSTDGDGDDSDSQSDTGSESSSGSAAFGGAPVLCVGVCDIIALYVPYRQYSPHF